MAIELLKDGKKAVLLSRGELTVTIAGEGTGVRIRNTLSHWPFPCQKWMEYLLWQLIRMEQTVEKVLPLILQVPMFFARPLRVHGG